MKKFLKHIDFPDYVKDNKLNMSNVLMNNSKLIELDLVKATIVAILYTKKEDKLLSIFIEESEISEDLILGAKAAANIMSMNNIYYRGKHHIGEEYSYIPANLRMNIYTKHGIDKKYFEFISLSVSFINNCEFCIKSHSALLEKEGFSKEQVHEALRIAAIFNTVREKY
jgi:alkyl hydroperoxide reductase subunit D